MLVAENLSCVRGYKLLFEQINFTVSAGQCLHIKGANGAGKTSLLKLICGLSFAEEGQLTWNNQPVKGLSSTLLDDLLFVGHRKGIKAELTAIENLHLAAALLNMTTVDAPAIFNTLGLQDIQRPAGQLSAGQQQRVALARLWLTTTRRLWVLDEPWTALDTAAQQTLAHAIVQHCHSGGIAVFTAHQPIGLNDCDLQELVLA